MVMAVRPYHCETAYYLKSMEQRPPCCATEATGAQGHGHHATRAVKVATTTLVCSEAGMIRPQTLGQMVPAGGLDGWKLWPTLMECCSGSLLLLLTRVQLARIAVEDREGEQQFGPQRTTTRDWSS